MAVSGEVGLKKSLKVNRRGVAINGGVGKIAYLQLCLVVICSIHFLHNLANDVGTGS